MSCYYTYLRETYKDIPVYKVLVAHEVYDTLIESEVVKLDDDQYEEVCDYVYNYVMHSEMSVNELTNLIHDAHISGEPIIDLILNGQWEEADEIIYARM